MEVSNEESVKKKFITGILNGQCNVCGESIDIETNTSIYYYLSCFHLLCGLCAKREVANRDLETIKKAKDEIENLEKRFKEKSKITEVAEEEDRIEEEEKKEQTEAENEAQLHEQLLKNSEVRQDQFEKKIEKLIKKEHSVTDDGKIYCPVANCGFVTRMKDLVEGRNSGLISICMTQSLKKSRVELEEFWKDKKFKNEEEAEKEKDKIKYPCAHCIEGDLIEKRFNKKAKEEIKEKKREGEDGGEEEEEEEEEEFVFEFNAFEDEEKKSGLQKTITEISSDIISGKCDISEYDLPNGLPYYFRAEKFCVNCQELYCKKCLEVQHSNENVGVKWSCGLQNCKHILANPNLYDKINYVACKKHGFQICSSCTTCFVPLCVQCESEGHPHNGRIGYKETIQLLIGSAGHLREHINKFCEIYKIATEAFSKFVDLKHEIHRGDLINYKNNVLERSVTHNKKICAVLMRAKWIFDEFFPVGVYPNEGSDSKSLDFAIKTFSENFEKRILKLSQIKSITDQIEKMKYSKKSGDLKYTEDLNKQISNLITQEKKENEKENEVNEEEKEKEKEEEEKETDKKGKGKEKEKEEEKETNGKGKEKSIEGPKNEKELTKATNHFLKNGNGYSPFTLLSIFRSVLSTLMDLYENEKLYHPFEPSLFYNITNSAIGQWSPLYKKEYEGKNEVAIEEGEEIENKRFDSIEENIVNLQNLYKVKGKIVNGGETCVIYDGNGTLFKVKLPDFRVIKSLVLFDKNGKASDKFGVLCIDCDEYGNSLLVNEHGNILIFDPELNKIREIETISDTLCATFWRFDKSIQVFCANDVHSYRITNWGYNNKNGGDGGDLKVESMMSAAFKYRKDLYERIKLVEAKIVEIEKSSAGNENEEKQKEVVLKEKKDLLEQMKGTHKIMNDNKDSVVLAQAFHGHAKTAVILTYGTRYTKEKKKGSRKVWTEGVTVMLVTTKDGPSLSEFGKTSDFQVVSAAFDCTDKLHLFALRRKEYIKKEDNVPSTEKYFIVIEDVKTEQNQMSQSIKNMEAKYIPLDISFDPIYGHALIIGNTATRTGFAFSPMVVKL